MDSARTRTEEHIEMALAAQLQEALRPRECPLNCPQHRAAARSRMCGSIGGDFHDFLRLNEDQIAVVIGDVAGHGVHSALVMAHILGFLRQPHNRQGRPSEVAKALNRMLVDLGDRADTVTCCTLIYGVIDAPTGLGLFVNAGHPHPFLCNADHGTVVPLPSHALLLGVQEFEPEEICLTFEPGQRLVLFTDGIVDSRNGRGDLFGEDRLRALIRQHQHSDPAQCADAVFDAVQAHRDGQRQFDDETIVVIDRM